MFKELTAVRAETPALKWGKIMAHDFGGKAVAVQSSLGDWGVYVLAVTGGKEGRQGRCTSISALPSVRRSI